MSHAEQAAKEAAWIAAEKISRLRRRIARMDRERGKVDRRLRAARARNAELAQRLELLRLGHNDHEARLLALEGVAQ